MNIDCNMKLAGNGDKSPSSDLKKWSGVYTTVEMSDIIIRIVEAEDEMLFRKRANDPEIVGEVDCQIFRATKRRGRSTYWTNNISGSILYPYHEEHTINDLIRWIRENEGYNLEWKVVDYTKYGSDVL